MTDTTMKTEDCGECAHFHDLDERANRGTCKRYPPVLIAFNAMSKAATFRQPLVAPHDHCGEWFPAR